MPKINRTISQEYAFILIHNGEYKITDITRPRNISGYSWVVKKILSGEKVVKRPNKVVEWVKANDLKYGDLRFDKFDTFYGTHQDAILHLEKLSQKLGIKSNVGYSVEAQKIHDALYPSGKAITETVDKQNIAEDDVDESESVNNALNMFNAEKVVPEPKPKRDKPFYCELTDTYFSCKSSLTKHMTKSKVYKLAFEKQNMMATVC